MNNSQLTWSLEHNHKKILTGPFVCQFRCYNAGQPGKEITMPNSSIAVIADFESPRDGIGDLPAFATKYITDRL